MPEEQSAGGELVVAELEGENHALEPYDRLISDAAGNLYGTTALGGASGAGIEGVTSPMD